MKSPRKTLGKTDSLYILSLRRLIETQSKATVVQWCLDYAEREILPVYERRCEGDMRPRMAISAARDWLDGKVRLPYVRRIILNECHQAARERADDPAAQAAARAVGQAASSIHAVGHALGLAFYGAAAIAYDRVGTDASADCYDRIAAEECAKMEAALLSVAVENEPDPVQVTWHW